MNEREIITSITRCAPTTGPGLIKSIGDDCAVLEKDAHTAWVTTMDTLVENVHFNPDWHPPRQLGRKSVSVNVSDVAAMGARPLFLLLSLGMPRSFDQQWFSDFSQGIAAGCKDYGCVLIGGDTVSSPEGLAITVTVIGEAPKQQVKYRHTAQPGDWIWVSGHLGNAAAGLELFKQGRKNSAFQTLFDAHLNPEARTALGAELGTMESVHSMMDLSDGMATDLAHICDSSGVQGEIEADRLPLLPALHQAANLLQQPAIPLALTGGEDYELLFTAHPKSAPQLTQMSRAHSLRLSRVGTIREGNGVVLRQTHPDGTTTSKPITYAGFDHFPTS